MADKYSLAEKMLDVIKSIVGDSVEKAVKKKEGDEMLPASAYAYTPDNEMVSTWKLRIDDARHVAAAVAALGEGFRGNKVEIPEAELPDVKRRVARAYRKFFPDNELPNVLKSLEQDVELFAGVEIAKSTSQYIDNIVEAKKQALFVVLEPQDGEYTSDLHQDTYTIEEVEKACHNFNKYQPPANYMHWMNVKGPYVLESYTAPVDMFVGDKEVRKGTWLQLWQFDDVFWPRVISGEINGVSIGCSAKWDGIDE